jgi:hypothetical protein
MEYLKLQKGRKSKMKSNSRHHKAREKLPGMPIRGFPVSARPVLITTELIIKKVSLVELGFRGALVVNADFDHVAHSLADLSMRRGGRGSRW